MSTSKYSKITLAVCISILVLCTNSATETRLSIFLGCFVYAVFDIG